jgi:hypothetical protein
MPFPWITPRVDLGPLLIRQIILIQDVSSILFVELLRLFLLVMAHRHMPQIMSMVLSIVLCRFVRNPMRILG